MKEKKKICKACNKNKCGYGGFGGGKAEPELVKIDRIKLKKVPMPVEAKSYKKMAKGSKGGFRVLGTKFGGGYSFPEPLVNPEPEVLALPEPEIFTKKQLVSYDYQYYPDYYGDGGGGGAGDYYDDYSGMMMPNMTTMMDMMTTTTMMPPTMASFVTFNPVNVQTGKRK